MKINYCIHNQKYTRCAQKVCPQGYECNLDDWREVVKFFNKYWKKFL